ncbi:ABC transporter permease subunit [Candidatus Gracilibacteria bacterium]|nr:ABC transporter permease subunit [Candidatus Gracilibacteria bacterium]
MFLSLLRAEWLKLRLRPLGWLLLAIFLVLIALYLSLWYVIAALHSGLIGVGEAELVILSDAQIAQIERQLSFPGIFGAVLGQINGIGGILAVILAGGALGSEYGWGTLRTQLSHAPQRGQLLAAKCVALALLVLLAMVIALAVGSAFALLYSTALGLENYLTAADLARIVLGMGRALFILAPYMLASLACAALGRSVLSGIGGGMLFLIVDIGLGSIDMLGAGGEVVRSLLNLSLQPNINALVVANSRSFGIDQSVFARALDLANLPPTWQAVLIIVVYCVLFYYMAHQWLTKRDIGGPV